MKLLYFGNNIRGVRCLEAILAEGRHEVVGVVVQPGKEHDLNNVAGVAQAHQLPIYAPAKVNASDFINLVHEEIQPDLAILSGYTQILREDIINAPHLGTINLHGGKLPDYRGAAPLNWQIVNGETQGGLCIMYVDEGIDTGDIIAQQYYDIGLDDTIGTVLEKSLEIFPPLLLQVLAQIESGTAIRTSQNPLDGAYYTRRFPRDGLIDWQHMTAKQAYDLVRALSHPYPGAFTTLNGEKLIIWRAMLLDQKIISVPGRVCMRMQEGAVIMAADRGLLLVEAQRATDPTSLPANDILRPLYLELGG